MSKYSTELKQQIVNDYQKGVVGYKRLAKKYGLTRDAIRGILVGNQKKEREKKLLKKRLLLKVSVRARMTVVTAAAMF